MKIYKSKNQDTCIELDNWNSSNWRPGRHFFDLVDDKAGITFMIPTNMLGEIVFLTTHLLTEAGHRIETPEELAELLEETK